MKQLVDNLVEHLSMGKQEHLAFLDGLFYLIKQKDADVVDYQGLKAQSVSPQCPKCESIKHYKKWSSTRSAAISMQGMWQKFSSYNRYFRLQFA